MVNVNKISAEERYKSLFKQRADQLNGAKDTRFFSLKTAAMDRLGTIAFPHPKNEDWKYTNLTRFLKTTYSQVGDPLRDVSYNPPILSDAFSIRFVNGKFDAQNSDLDKMDDGVDLFTIEQALNVPEFGGKVQTELDKIIDHGATGFELLNLGFVEKGWVLRIQEDTSLSKPVQMIYEINHREESMMVSHLLLVFVGTGAKVKILEANIGTDNGSDYFKNVQNRFVVEENATLQYYKVQEEGPIGHLIHHTEVTQEKASHFSSLQVDLGGKLIRNNIYAQHLSELVTTDLYGVYLAEGERQHIDNQTFIDHAYPNCQSNELYKGIIAGHSKAVFNGKVIVRPDAQKINAFQQNANLVLSDHAEVNTKPQLEIFADDVRCSHGATIGQLDPQAMYYLQTRGLSKVVAEELLKKAFLHEVFTRLEGDETADQINNWLLKRLG